MSDKNKSPFWMLALSCCLMFSITGCNNANDNNKKNGVGYMTTATHVHFDLCGSRVKVLRFIGEQRFPIGLQGSTDHQLRLRVRMQVVGSDSASPKKQSAHGSIEIYSACSTLGGGVWAKGNPKSMDWDSIRTLKPLGLEEFRRSSGVSNRTLVFAPLEKYTKPDGSPFSIQADSLEDFVPLQLSVTYALSDRLYINYVYQPGDISNVDEDINQPSNLVLWKEIDTLVRQIITKED